VANAPKAVVGQVEDQAPAARCVLEVVADLLVAAPLALPLRGDLQTACNIMHIKRVREWELAQAACRLAFSRYGQPRGCYAARLGSKGPLLALLKATRVNGDVPRLAAARTRHKEGREELGKGAGDI
jgi:hypothetical protein